MNEIMQNMSEELEKAIEQLNLIETALRKVGDMAYIAELEPCANAAGAVMVMTADMLWKISENLDQLKDDCDKIKKGAE